MTKPSFSMSEWEEKIDSMCRSWSFTDEQVYVIKETFREVKQDLLVSQREEVVEEIRKGLLETSTIGKHTIDVFDYYARMKVS